MLYMLFGGISDNTDQPDSGASLSVTFRKDKVSYSHFHFYSIECKTNRGSTLKTSGTIVKAAVCQTFHLSKIKSAL